MHPFKLKISHRLLIPVAVTYLIVAIWLQSCSTVEPVDKVMVKTIHYDTLSSPRTFQTILRSFYALTEDDVYLAGHNDGGVGSLWHYNGMAWSDVKLTKRQGGLIDSPVSLSDICGNGVDIYAVGGNTEYESVIIQLISGKWQRVDKGGLPDFTSCVMRGSELICGDRSGNLHYFENGSTRVEPTTHSQPNSSNIAHSTMYGLKIPDDRTLYYLIADRRSIDTPEYYTLESYREGVWRVLDSTNSDSRSKWRINKACLYNHKITLAVDDGVYTISDTGRVLWMRPSGRVRNLATNGTDLVIVNGQELVLYKGNRFYHIETVDSRLVITNLIYTGKKIFVVCYADIGGLECSVVITITLN